MTILKIYFTLRNLVKLSYFFIDNFVTNKLWIYINEGKIGKETYHIYCFKKERISRQFKVFAKIET